MHTKCYLSSTDLIAKKQQIAGDLSKFFLPNYKAKKLADKTLLN